MAKIRITPMSDDLRRQRRNLIAISFILYFMKYGGINITKTTVLGTEIELSNVSAIFLGLWLMWVYFFVRYYQYFMQEGVTSIRRTLYDLLTENCRQKIGSIVRSEHPRLVEGGDQRFDYNILKKSSWSSIHFVGKELTEDPNEFKQIDMNIPLWQLRREIFISYATAFLNLSVMTDYVFPIVFALAAMVYCNLGDWPGNISNLFSS